MRPRPNSVERLVAAALSGASASLALGLSCSDTPRGVQGIDFYNEAGVDGYDAGDVDAAIDAHGPCQEVADPTGVCAQLNGPGSLYTHRIDCVGGAQPLYLDCDTTDGGADAAPPDGGIRTFCCTTGLL